MTTQPEPVTTGDELLDGEYAGPVKIRGPLRRLLWWMVPAYFAVFVVGGAFSSIMLGLQVGYLDETNKVANLAIVVTVGAVVGLIGQPLGGLLSDRTRSRWGRRTPWIVGGGALGLVGVAAMGIQSNIVGIAICWGIAQTGYTLANGPLTAVLPDRVPRRARGTFAAFTGLGAILAGIFGNFLGSAFRDALPVGYVVIGAIILVVLVLFCLANRDPDSRGLVADPIDWRALGQAFWVSPRRHPDFFWVFCGRFLLFLGYGIATGYALYLLADYIGLGLDAAAATAPWLTVAAVPTGLIALLGAGPLSDKLGGRRKPFVLIASVLIALGLAAPLVSPTIPGMIVMMAVLGLGFGTFQSVDTALATEVLPSSASYGKDLGVLNIAASLPGTLVPAVAGTIISLGAYVAVFPVGIALVSLAALAVLPIKGVR